MEIFPCTVSLVSGHWLEYFHELLKNHCILVDSSTVIYWTSPFVILGVLGLFCGFYSIFDGKFCLQTL